MPVGQHGAQTCPMHNTFGAHARNALLRPIHQGSNAVFAHVSVVAIELRHARPPETIVAKAAGNTIWCRRRGIALGVVQIDGDGVALDCVAIDAVAKLGGQIAAGRSRANHHAVEGAGARLGAMAHGDARVFAAGAHGADVLTVQHLRAPPLGSQRHAVGELMDVSGRVAFSEVAPLF